MRSTTLEDSIEDPLGLLGKIAVRYSQRPPAGNEHSGQIAGAGVAEMGKSQGDGGSERQRRGEVFFLLLSSSSSTIIFDYSSGEHQHCLRSTRGNGVIFYQLV